MKLSHLTLEEVPELYRTTLSREGSNGTFQRSLHASAPAFLSQSSKNGVTLEILVDRNSHTVRAAGHSGTGTEISRRLLDRLCGFLIEKPVNECYDHAVLCLEYFLRDPSLKRPVAGITTPFNAWSIFRELTDLVRSAVQAYKDAVGDKDTKNFFVRRSSPRWAGMSKEERLAEAARKISEYCLLHGFDPTQIQAVELTREVRLVLDIARPLYLEDPRFMIKLESYLKEKMEPTVSLFLKEEEDRNLIRRDEVRNKQYKETPS